MENAGSDANLKLRTQLAFKYCIRRFVRILPLAWIWAFVPFIGSLYFNRSGGFGPPAELLSEFFAVLRFQYNYFAVSTGFGHISHFWSLAVEEHYYLFLPLFLLIIPNRKLCIAGLCLITFTCSVHRILAWKSGTGFGGISLLTHFRVDSLAIGSIIALLTRQIQIISNIVGSQLKLQLGLSLTASLAIAYLWAAPSLISRSGIVYFGYFSFALASAFLVASASLCKQVIPCPELLRPSIAAIGKRSYTLYLIHLPILIAIREARFRIFGIASSQTWDNWIPLIIELTVFLVILIALTELNFRILEAPLIEIARTHFGEVSTVLRPISNSSPKNSTNF
jgi:peptidoglycan/LPS O-acetylase OafA/YrhL